MTNELEKETSPYLLQHADNPVEWMPWGKKAFERAKKEQKPIFLSIGYATCHWCHVMEEESFSNKKIAQLLNKYFICIKIDREELPHVDVLYQQLYKKHYGRFGGWPLNLFMTADKKVFYITNYIPPLHESYAEGFDTLLLKLHNIYENKKLLEKNMYLYRHIQKRFPKSTKEKQLSLKSLIRSIKKEYDSEDVGFGKSKRFPQAAKTALVLQLAELTDNKELKKNYFELLDIMTLRGLYDHVDGGFFRYSVDEAWEIPHFEKMLYTQAELIPLYVRGYVLEAKPLYKDVIKESIAMLDRYFLYKDYYFSASDADSNTQEGGFFIFTQDEIKKALRHNPHAKAIEEAMEFSFEGNFHDKVHINFYTDKRPKGFTVFQKELQKIREKRAYPFIDKKINTAWNAMMIEALYIASVVDKSYALKAKNHLEALTELMFDKGALYHQTVPKRRPTQKGLLEDYAFFISALIAAYEVEYDEKRLDFAAYLLQQAKEKFYKNGIWYLSDDDLHIKADLSDKYYTSAQSKMLQNILKLAALKASFTYEKFAQESLKNLHSELQEKQSTVPALASAYLMQKYGMVVLKSSKKNLVQQRKNIEEIWYPYILRKAENYNDYLACTLRRCFAKESTMKAIKTVIKTLKR
ncbi:DUF255 domain-containing protein [Sulfurimonas sp. NWX79]|uniref:thioredoxin domain-containing protein n=1 Tax=Sulfurimonas sp. NWX79 TaxID=2925412 RepID=UPI0032049505